MKCPKCGFDQPQDTFCASCGVHVEKFQLRHPSNKNIQFYLNKYKILIFLILLVTFSIYKTIFNESVLKNSANQFADQKNEAIPKIINSDQNVIAEKLESYSEERKLASPDVAEKTEPLQQIPLSLKVYGCILNPKDVSTSIGRPINPMSFEQTIGENKSDLTFLQKCMPFKLRSSEIGQSFSMSAKPIENIKTGIQFNINNLNLNDRIEFEIEIDKKLIQFSEGIISPFYSNEVLNLQFSKNGYAIISGLLPHRLYSKQEEKFYKGTTLEFILSKEFELFQKDLFIVLLTE